MQKIALTSKDCKSRSAYLDSIALPLTYMEDFSLLGFTVDNLQKAVFLLKKCGYKVTAGEAGGQIYIENFTQIRDIQNLFSDNSLASDFTDIADTFYQA